jgi:hypothetical protein
MSAIDPHTILDPVSEAAIEISKKTINASYALTALSTVVFLARIWTRTRPVYRMGWDDYCISIAYVMLTLSTTIWMASSYKVIANPGHHTLADTQSAMFFTYVGRWFWPWAMSFVKLGVGIMLLRFHRDKFWRGSIYLAICLQFTQTIYTMIFYSIECRPASGNWNKALRNSQCIPIRITLVSIGVVAGVNVFTDLVLSLAPIPILMRIRRPLIERIAVGWLMAMGLTAAAASLIKTVNTFKRRTPDQNYNQGSLRMWALIEEDLAFIAACIPTLKGPMHRLLAYLGLAPLPRSADPSWNPSSKGYSSRATESKSAHSYVEERRPRDILKMKNIRQDDFSQSEEDILGLAEIRRAPEGEIWCTEEFQIDEERVEGRPAGRDW